MLLRDELTFTADVNPRVLVSHEQRAVDANRGVEGVLKISRAGVYDKHFFTMILNHLGNYVASLTIQAYNPNTGVWRNVRTLTVNPRTQRAEAFYLRGPENEWRIYGNTVGGGPVDLKATLVNLDGAIGGV